jgi:two-component system chemotaxis sensor kinase CheA
MGIDLSQFHATFFEESFEGLDIMESSLLDMDHLAEVDADLLNTIFRAAHSIKGGSGTFGFGKVSAFTHSLETLLDRIRCEEIGISQAIINSLLEAVDCAREMLLSEKEQREHDSNHVEEVQARLDKFLTGTEAPVAEAVDNEIAMAGERAGWQISFNPHPHMIKTGNDPVRILRELSSLGHMEVESNTDKLPAFMQLDPESCWLSWDIKLYGDIDEELVKEVFEWVVDDCDLKIEALSEENANLRPADGSVQADVLDELSGSHVLSETLAATESDVVADNVGSDAEPHEGSLKTGQQRHKRAADNSSIRVGTDKVDELINLVGELVITQSMLSEIGNDFDASKIERMMAGLAQLERHTRELQDSVLRIRMLPISFTFNRFPRLVHDLGNKLGKKIELRMSGEGTELDKSVMEKIGDPLTHLIRNSLDHGLETPDIRKAAGKPETGVLHLNAYHKGGNIIIEISDDGAGFDREKIRSRAIQKGLIAEDEILTEEKIHELIFAPGFSTADKVSDVSGRGVGMDVVRKNIRELGGAVDVVSTQGQGSIISIRLPLTLAIMDGQLVRVGSEIYIIPLVSIIESLQAKEQNIKTIVDDAEVYRLRDEYINIVRLHEVFNITPDKVDICNGLLVMVEGESGKIGIYVDELLGQQQVVIKSLETNYKRINGISGATILGDGTVAMIVDVSGLVAISGANRINQEAGRVA